MNKKKVFLIKKKLQSKFSN